MAAAFRGLAAERRRWDDAAEPCPALRLPRGPDPLSAVVPKPMLRDLRNYRQRAGRAGAPRFERADEANLNALFEAQLRLHRARWETRGEAGVLAGAQVQAAHREALPGLLRAGVLRPYALRLDGTVIGTLYGFLDRPGGAERRFYSYLGGFDPEFARISPGTLLIAHAVKEAAREGATLFDFLRGQERYNYLWGAEEVPTWRRRLRPRR